MPAGLQRRLGGSVGAGSLVEVREAGAASVEVGDSDTLMTASLVSGN